MQENERKNYFLFILILSIRSEPRSFASTFPVVGIVGIDGADGVGIAAESENCSLYGSDEEQEDDTQYW